MYLFSSGIYRGIMLMQNELVQTLIYTQPFRLLSNVFVFLDTQHYVQAVNIMLLSCEFYKRLNPYT